MVLIDASNVDGGGAVLLQYLETQLQATSRPFYVLRKQNAADGQADEVVVTPVNRHRILKQTINDEKPNALLCFGNFPPPFRPSLRTITYFHNPHYVRNHDDRNFSTIHAFKKTVRRLYLKHYLANSDLFVVQTPFIREAFLETYPMNLDRVRVLPFFDDSRMIEVRDEMLHNRTVKVPATFLYASSSDPHKNHGALLTAWELLLAEGLTPTLYLTVSPTYTYTTPRLLQQIERLQRSGASVINLGKIPHRELLQHTFRCTYCIFPSVNETIGLGLVEACYMNNYILASNRPYLPDVVKPSDTFDPHDPAAIAHCVRKALEQGSRHPSLVIRNQIDDFIKLLYEE
jgi:glycosyltransferase involved in cell wall biosynthesis